MSGEEALEPGHRESLLPDAEELALNWMRRDREETRDEEFLRRLGIGDGPGASNA